MDRATHLLPDVTNMARNLGSWHTASDHVHLAAISRDYPWDNSLATLRFNLACRINIYSISGTMEWAVRFGHDNTLYFMYTNYPVVAHKKREALFRIAASNGRLAVCEFLACHGLTIYEVRSHNKVRSYDNYALRMAAKHDHLPVLQFLKKFVDPSGRRLSLEDVRDNHHSALARAAEKGNLAVLKFFSEWTDKDSDTKLTTRDAQIVLWRNITSSLMVESLKQFWPIDETDQ